jgi:hypothetical protein
MIQWQQVYMIIVAIIGIVADLILIGYTRKPVYIGYIISIVWTFYVLYSAGFYKGLLY